MDIIFASLMIGILVVFFGAMLVGFISSDTNSSWLWWSFFSMLVSIVCTGVIVSQISKLKESLKPLLAQKEPQADASAEAKSDPNDPPSDQ